MVTARGRTEHDLVDLLERALTTPPVRRPGHLRTFREFEPGMGRVDLLGVRCDPSKLARRARTASDGAAEALTVLGGYAMTRLEGRGWIEQSDLATALRLGRSDATRLLDRLQARGMVVRRGDRVRARPRSTLWSIIAIESYEAKLHQWRMALNQACRHLWFVSHSYIAMPAPSARVHARLAAQCAQLPVGVVVCNGWTSWSLATLPPERTAPSTPVGWMLNEILFDEARRAAV